MMKTDNLPKTVGLNYKSLQIYYMKFASDTVYIITILSNVWGHISCSVRDSISLMVTMLDQAIPRAGITIL